MSTNDLEASPPLPSGDFTLHQALPRDVQDDLLMLYLLWMRCTAVLGNCEAAWLMAGRRVTSEESTHRAGYSPAEPYHDGTGFPKFLPDRLLVGDCSAEELGLRFGDIEQTDFVRHMRAMYEYGVHAVLDRTLPYMEMDSRYTLLAALVLDLRRSNFVDEWDYIGVPIKESIERCARIVELANARRVLEGKGCFFYFSGTKEEEINVDDSLSVRQLALLADMEEMSIRAAANPKRANALQTINERGRTRIRIDVAKAWLQSKGRYLPIKRIASGSDVDPLSLRCVHRAEFYDALNDRYLFLVASGRKPDLPTDASAEGWETTGAAILFQREDINDDIKIGRLASLLDLDERRLKLRARQTVATEMMIDASTELEALDKGVHQ